MAFDISATLTTKYSPPWTLYFDGVVVGLKGGVGHHGGSDVVLM